MSVPPEDSFTLHAVTCFVEGCYNYASPVVLYVNSNDPLALCGPCGNYILTENIVPVVP